MPPHAPRYPLYDDAPPPRAIAHPPSPAGAAFLSAEGRTSTLDVDGALTVGQLKDVIEDESFIPADLRALGRRPRPHDGHAREGTQLATSAVDRAAAERRRRRRVALQVDEERWKWKKKRTRRLRRKRRQDARAREVDNPPWRRRV